MEVPIHVSTNLNDLDRHSMSMTSIVSPMPSTLLVYSA